MKDAFMCVTVTVSTQSWSQIKPVTADVLGGAVLTFTACIMTLNTSHAFEVAFDAWSKLYIQWYIFITQLKFHLSG